MSKLQNKKNKITNLLTNIWKACLRTTDINTHDEFISLGGNSLIALHIIHKINELLKIALPLNTIFQYNTVEKLSHFLEEQAIAPSSIATAHRQAWKDLSIPLTLAQQPIYFLSCHSDEASLAYHMPLLFEMTGELNIRALEQAINAIIHRHDVFQTYFKESPQGITQQLHDNIAVHLQVESIQTKNLHKRIYLETRKKIQLGVAPLLKVRLLKLADNRHFLFLTQHHIISDAWSIAIFKKELEIAYIAFSKGSTPNLKTLQFNYFDFIYQQMTYLNSKQMQTDSNYWQTKLVNFTEITFPTDFKRPSIKKFRGKRYHFTLDKKMTEAINHFTVENKITPFMLSAAILSLLLGRYNHQEDIVIGFPVSGRDASEFSHTMGLFLNSLVLKSYLQETDTLYEFLLRIKQDLLDAYTHQNFPFAHLVKQLNVPRYQNKNPIFQVMLVWQDSLDNASLVFPNLTLTPHTIDNRTAKFDMTFEFIPSRFGIDCFIEYDTELYKLSTIKRIACHFTHLLISSLNAPHKKLLALDFITQQEKKLFLATPNLEKLDSVSPPPLHLLFEQQAERFPNKIALRHTDLTLTYQALNQRANQLAYYIRQHYSKIFIIVNTPLLGICLDRGLNLIITLIAIVKAGAAYVPLDPDWPQKRLDTILKDADCPLILTDSPNKTKFNGITQNLLNVDEIRYELDTLPNINVNYSINAQAWLYVIYTSGTTGLPKGVPQTHYNIVRLLKRGNELLQFTHEDVWLLFHSYAFDFSVWEIWGALRFGACLVIPSYQETRDPALFYQLVLQTKLTILNQTPSAFRLFMQAEQAYPTRINTLKTIIFGGEALDINLLATWWKRYPENQPTLVNMYGITETSVHATFKFLSKKDLTRRELSNIGIPLADIKAYVVDSYDQLTPIGVPGELLLSGFGLSPGYLNRPQLNIEKFIKNNFHSPLNTNNNLVEKAFARSYKTGDLVRWLSDGSLEYLGRLDKQLKITGFRIEAGEIEAALMTHNTIQQCLVTVLRQNNLDILAAYYIPVKEMAQIKEKKQLHIALRSYLAALLPYYAIPKFFSALTAFPLTQNMKIDYAALPIPLLDPEEEQLDIEHANKTPTETILSEIWQAILQITPAAKDNFFNLGGDSITSIMVVNAARKKGFTFSVSDLFKTPTIQALATHYKDTVSKKNVSLKPLSETKKKQIISKKYPKLSANLEDLYPLTALQAGMIYHSSYSAKSAIYLDIFSYTISGAYNKDYLIQALQNLLATHPVLRTSYLINEFDEPVQLINKSVEIPLSENDLSKLSRAEQAHHLKSWTQNEKLNPFHYEQAPLFRITIHILDKKQFIFGIAFHHSLLDGWSLATFMTELLETYQLQLNQPIQKKKVDWNFKKFVQLERTIRTSPTEQQFWENELRDFHLTEIPRTSNSLSENHKDFYTHCVQLDSNGTLQLMQLAKSLNLSLDEIILTAHMKFLSIYSSQEDVLSGVVFNARPEIDNIDKTLGLFLNTLPFRIAIQDCNWKALIQLVSEKKKLIYPHRHYPLMKIMRDNKVDSLFHIIFYFTHFHVYNQLKQHTQLKIVDKKHYERTNFPLAINCTLDPINKKLEILFNYEAQYYNAEQISELADCYIRLLKTIVTDTDAPHTRFDLLTPSQKQQLLVDWNKTKSFFPSTKRAHELIEEIAEKFPQKTALIFQDNSLTFYELNNKANQLANYLNEKKLLSNPLIALCVERSLEAIIAMLAVWKAGKAYIPIDPLYPKERIQYILSDAQCHCLITQKTLSQDLVTTSKTDIIYLDDLNIMETTSSSKNLTKICSEAKLAYVIYTSGSTGMPKGVMLEHSSLVNLLWDMQKKLDFSANDTFLALTSFSFDISILEIFLPLISGGCCVIADQSGSKDPRWIKDTLKNHPITIVQATASKWDLIFEQGLFESKCKIRALCGGEALSTRIAAQLIAFADSAWNVYGPTETTIWSTIHKLKKADLVLTHPPIGKPIANTNVYVLDKKLQPLPIGVTGDLYISGVGVARGYLNRPDLTKERFIKNPFTTKDTTHNILYQTGDLAKWLANGCLDYVARSDQQIKVRGFRVEAGEIEYALLQQQTIKECVVLLKESNTTQFLVAFLVKKSTETEINSKQIREFLAKRLPYYCLPDKYVFLPELPRTQNEKIDRRQLMSIAIEEVSPSCNNLTMSPEQSKLADIWKQVLCIKQISLSDNFFDLGGNSLLTLRLINKINKEFAIMLEIKEIIEHPVLAALSDKIVSLQDSQKKNNTIETTIDFVKSISDPIIKLKNSGSKTPLFLIHPVGGNVFYYIPFVNSLDNDRPVYAIQDPGIRCREPLFESLNDMARFYIKVLKTYQPKGPYLIAGSSFGANAAVEMARQLADQGDKLAFVGLIDGWAKYPKEANENREWFCQNLINQLKTLDQHFSKADIPELLLDLHWHRQQLLVKHILPTMSDLQLTLFKAQQTMEVLKPLESACNNWDSYCQTLPTVYSVPGDHFTMHFSPHHESLAAAFRACLAKVKD
jgi:amino acid adenylation domain-containing protein